MFFLSQAGAEDRLHHGLFNDTYGELAIASSATGHYRVDPRTPAWMQATRRESTASRAGIVWLQASVA